MLGYNLINLILAHFSAQFLHSEMNIFCCNHTRRIGIKLVEDCLQFFISQEFFHIKCSRQELRVVDLVILLVVHLIDDIVYFFVAEVYVLL